MKSGQIVRSLLAGIGVAAVGIPVAYALFLLPFTWLLSAAAGYGAGTFIYRAGGRNGGALAIVISVVAVAIPFLVLLAPDLLAGEAGVRRLVAMVFAAIAAGVANRQL